MNQRKKIIEDKKHKKTGGVLFIDLKAAFDTVPHDILLDLIHKLNVFPRED